MLFECERVLPYRNQWESVSNPKDDGLAGDAVEVQLVGLNSVKVSQSHVVCFWQMDTHDRRIVVSLRYWPPPTFIVEAYKSTISNFKL